MADIQLRIRSDSSTAQREIQALRRELATLRGQLDQTERSADGAGNEIDQLGDESQQTATQIGRMGDAAQRTSRETQGMTRGVGAATGGTQVFTRSLSGLGSVLGGLGIAAAGIGAFRLGEASVVASVKVEGFRNSLAALYGDAQIANTVLSDLQELAQLPGITFESAVQGAVRLKTVGVEGARAEGVIREFGNAAALAGASSVELGRSLVGFTQILSRGKVSQEEINQVLEAVPLIGVSIREAFGSIDAETIRAQLDAAGQGVQDFTDILVNQLSKGARASAESTRNAFSNLENATFRLHTAIGDRLSPAVRAATGFLTDLANTTADFVIGTDAATEATERFHAAIVNADNAIARDESITNRIQVLREYIAELQRAERNRGIFDRRGRAQLGGEIAGEQVELGRLTRIEAGDAEFIRSLTAEVEKLTEFFVAHQQIQTQLENTAARFSENQQRRFDIRRENLDEEEDAILAQLELREGELQAAQEAAGSVADAEREKIKATEAATAATEAAAQATKEAAEAAKEATVEIITYAEAIRQVQANIAAYVEEQALFADFGDFWSVASGQVSEYSTAIDLATVSVVDHQTELETLLNAGFFDGLDDPIKDYVAALEATSEVADKAFGSINQVGEAVGDADFGAAAAELTDFDVLSSYQKRRSRVSRQRCGSLPALRLMLRR